MKDHKVRVIGLDDVGLETSPKCSTETSGWLQGNVVFIVKVLLQANGR